MHRCSVYHERTHGHTTSNINLYPVADTVQPDLFKSGSSVVSLLRVTQVDVQSSFCWDYCKAPEKQFPNCRFPVLFFPNGVHFGKKDTIIFSSWSCSASSLYYVWLSRLSFFLSSLLGQSTVFLLRNLFLLLPEAAVAFCSLSFFLSLFLCALSHVHDAHCLQSRNTPNYRGK